MLLSSPVFPLSVNENDINNAVQKLVHSKGRLSFLIAEKKLIYMPFWFLDYATYIKKDGLVEHSKGSKAMNASTNEFDSAAAEPVKNLPKEMAKSLEVNTSTEIIKPKSSRNDAKKAAQMAVAAEKNLPPENVTITSFNLYYIPFWNISAMIGGANYTFRINAFSGKIIDEGGLTVKEKNIQELIQETINELTTPQGWVSNSKSAINSVMDIFGGTSKTLNFQKVSPIDMAIFLLLIVLVLVLLKII